MQPGWRAGWLPSISCLAEAGRQQLVLCAEEAAGRASPARRDLVLMLETGREVGVREEVEVAVRGEILSFDVLWGDPA